ncbi:MAG: DNA polymerase I [Saprospiraceae bacterium]|nr:DNA polymerase I [Candidatus Brachybacter algidus]
MSAEKRIFFIDGHAMVYRAHYAFINRPLMNSKGQNVSAINGFVRSVWELITNQRPTHLGVIFDPKGGTFRTELYAEYKAQRDAQPEDISFAIPYIIQIMKGMRIPVEIIPNFEADDVIGTLAKKAEKEGFQVFMVTPDKDYAQIVSENIFQYKPARFGNDIEILGVDDVLKKWEIKRIDQVIDLLGLMGDAVDNIPGLPGVGPKTAVKLLAEYDNVENIIANAQNLKGKLAETVAEKADLARLSKTLATIHLDVPVEFESTHYIMEEFDKEALMEVFKELEFRTLATTILGRSVLDLPEKSKPNKVTKGVGSEQGSLFETTESDVKTSTFDIAISNAEFNISNVDHEYIVVDSEIEWAKMFGDIQDKKFMCFDTETTSLDPIVAELVGISLSTEPHKAYYIPVPEVQVEAQKIVDRLRLVFEDPEIDKIGQNLKYDVSVLIKYNVRLAGKLIDTMLLHYLVEPDLRHGMDYMSESYLKYKPVAIEALIGEKKNSQISMREVPLEQIKEYAAEDADITLQLYNFLLPGLKEINSEKLYEDIESKLIYVLADLEMAGVNIDPDYLAKYSIVLSDRITEYEQNIYKEAGQEFNINSPTQVGELLFGTMKIPYRWAKTKQGKFSTDEVKLSELALEYKFVAEILSHRSLSKLRSTYVDSLPKMINPVTKRVHSSFNQALAATGRLSSNNPNLQNIPIKTVEGREIRKAFIAKDADHVILSADYSQIELRLIAELSKDVAMVEAFQQGLDIHSATAAKVYGVPLEEVTPEQRRNAKTVNFSIIYGAGSLNLSRQLGIKRTEAKEIIESYFTQFNGLKSYMDRMVNEAHEFGYVTTLMGRRRYLRDINSRNSLARSGAERIAVNSPIQGTAADMIKLAMIKIHEEFISKGVQSKMIMQVHDELVFDVLRTELDQVKEIVIRNMQNAIPGLAVPIEVSTGVGENWLEAH